MLFRASQYRYCAYCSHGAAIDEDEILCEKHGICASDSKCLSFSYDPMKRRPVSKCSLPDDGTDRDYSL